tara:strand:+ start:219 stop:857 length:639 start_codon:yes stop_codon:yes gene_type:complete
VAEKKFLDFLDRFDGGGMGKSGEKFEGGGLLSMLGNLFADPYGSDDKARMASRNAFYNAQGDTVPAPTLLAPRAGNRAAQKPAQGMSLPMAPSAAPQRMPSDPRLTMPVAPGGSPNDGLGPMPQRLQGDPSLGFNPANAAPVQPSAPAYTPHSSIDFRPSDFEVRPAPTEHYDTFLRRFEQRVGPEIAKDYPAQMLERLYIDYAINGDQFSS